MTSTLTAYDIALRLLLAVAAGLLIGANRSAHEHPAGLRTTLLVCLAAAVAMIQANILLITTMNQEGHTITLDLMRLPLGILSGMGFIGGGAILRRRRMVQGVTTAATLWLVTVIGLCFGGGQYGLGIAATGIGFVVLAALKKAEPFILRERHGMLGVEADADGFDEAALDVLLAEAGFRPVSRRIRKGEGGRRSWRLELRYSASPRRDKPRELRDRLSRTDGISSVEWSDNFGN